MENKTDNTICALKKYISKIIDITDDIEADLLKLEFDPFDEINTHTVTKIDTNVTRLKSMAKQIYNALLKLQQTDRNI